MNKVNCKDFKLKILDTCKNEILDKLTIIEKELKYLHYDIAEDTKSSAGDKFETSREMANAEVDKLQSQVFTMNKSMTMLNTIPLEPKPDIGLGSLFRTENSWIFISVSLGQLKIETENILVISPSAPLAKQFIGKIANDEVSFNGNSYFIKHVC
ncbi:MAG: hypothetical protein ABFS32_06675 [Bacteroidota bacterium]